MCPHCCHSYFGLLFLDRLQDCAKQMAFIPSGYLQTPSGKFSFRSKITSHKRGVVSGRSWEEGWLQHKRAKEYGRQKKLILPGNSPCFAHKSELCWPHLAFQCKGRECSLTQARRNTHIALQAKLRERNLLRCAGNALRNSSFIRLLRTWNKFLFLVLLNLWSTDLSSWCMAPTGWVLSSSLGYSSKVRKPGTVWPQLPSWLSSSDPLIIVLIKAAT